MRKKYVVYGFVYFGILYVDIRIRILIYFLKEKRKVIIVLTVLCVLLLGLAIWLLNEDEDWLGGCLSILAGIGLIICLVSIVILSSNVADLRVVDQKIEMYEQENTKIEEQISEVVKQYQDYESGIFTEVSPESAVTLVSLYPELKADTLVHKQIEVYLANNDKIKELKESKIQGTVHRWWLYFGG